MLDRIRQTLEAAGGRMSDVFKLVQYFKTLDHFAHYSRVRKLFEVGANRGFGPLPTNSDLSGRHAADHAGAPLIEDDLSKAA